MFDNELMSLLLYTVLLSGNSGKTYDDTEIKSDIADLQAEKADKSDVYTKAETNKEITSKVAEIVADAPEDFNTLKEMSDWISNHENDAAAMNSAIQTNTSNIASLQAGKVDKETGKSLVSDSEIARLSAVDNYDDTAVKADISSLQLGKVDKVTGKGLSTNDYTTTEKEKLASLENYTLPTASADTLGGVKIGEGLTIKDGVLSASGGGLGNLKIAYGMVSAPDTKDYVLDYSSAGFTQPPAIFATVIKADGKAGDYGTISIKLSSATRATLNRTQGFYPSMTWGYLNDFCWLAIGV